MIPELSGIPPLKKLVRGTGISYFFPERYLKFKTFYISNSVCALIFSGLFYFFAFSVKYSFFRDHNKVIHTNRSDSFRDQWQW